MLVLCSNGLTSENLLNKLRNKIIVDDSMKNAALVVTADHVYKSENYHVVRCIRELESVGLMVDIIDIDTKDAHVLLNYDVVEFIGGNPFYLLNSIRKNGVIEILKQIVSEKVLIGWSAASFVFGPTLELVNIYSPELNFLQLTDISGLHLTGVEVLPHYNDFIKKFDSFEERCSAYERKHNKEVIRLNDGDAVFIEGNTISVCRSSIK